MILNSIDNLRLPVYGDGLQVRDWIHVDDHCNAIEMIFNKSKAGKVYNIGGKNELSNTSAVDIIHKILTKYKPVKKDIKFIDDRYGHDRRYSLEIKKLQNELGWSPKIKFENGIEKLINSMI